MLQYALLHLFGYELSMDDLKSFRVSSLRTIYSSLLLILVATRQHHPRPPRGPRHPRC
jgi:hypothetical protein